MRRRSENTVKAGRGRDPRNKPVPGVDWLPATFLLALLAIWQGLSTVKNVPEFILPSPVKVLEELVSSWGLLMSHAGVTILEALLGLFSAIALGAAMGLAMGYFNAFRRMIYPFFVMTQTVPLFVLAPLFILWFGFGLLPKIIVVFLVCFFPIAVTFAQGLAGSDGGMEDLLTVMGASRWKIFRITRIPQALPHFFAGLKIAATYSIVGAVIAEWVGAQEGLGIFMTRAMKNFRTGALFADVLIVVALSLILYKAVELVEKKACENITNGV